MSLPWYRYSSVVHIGPYVKARCSILLYKMPPLQGPTVSPVYTNKEGKVEVDYYAITICFPKPQLYHAVRQLRKVLWVLIEFFSMIAVVVPTRMSLGKLWFWLKKVNSLLLGSNYCIANALIVSLVRQSWRICSLTTGTFGPVLQAGGSGVLVSPLTYIFDEETPRYRQLLEILQT